MILEIIILMKKHKIILKHIIIVLNEKWRSKMLFINKNNNTGRYY